MGNREDYIKGIPQILDAELLVEDELMTVRQVALAYRRYRYFCRLWAGLAVITAIALAGFTYWHTSHPNIEPRFSISRSCRQ